MDFGEIIGMVFTLGFLGVFLFVFSRIAKAFKQAGGAQTLQALAEQRKKELAARQQNQLQNQRTQTPITLQELLGRLEEQPMATQPSQQKAYSFQETSEVESSVSEVELDHSIESELKSYESLVPLSQQMESQVDIGTTLPHYERTEGIKSEDHHPIYGFQDDMGHTHISPLQSLESTMQVQRAHATRKSHPLRTHLNNPKNFRLAFLTTMILERPKH